ncbi:SsgA family sporulation/cell division regulator [Streptomyces sp. NPDC057428]|uniref:SsgA family sporulation/cell division regulator n=1 Tax=Streptomyces sp. NPDC057428 TaxID=3346129 RepID=UPI0036814027
MNQCDLTMDIARWLSPELAFTVSCEFSYADQDPFAVTLVLDADGVRPVRWVLSRDLLADGLTARSGTGDVMVWPVHDLPDGETSSFCLRLVNTHAVVFEIAAEPVAQWLARTYTMVPRGTEMDGADWDELLQFAD